jgi:hypothetical protein
MIDGHQYAGGGGSDQEAVDYEREYVQAQLRRRDNPYGLTVYWFDSLGWPPPLFEGQTMRWTERTHFCGRTLNVTELRVFLWNGVLGWAVVYT